MGQKGSETGVELIWEDHLVDRVVTIQTGVEVARARIGQGLRFVQIYVVPTVDLTLYPLLGTVLAGIDI